MRRMRRRARASALLAAQREVATILAQAVSVDEATPRVLAAIGTTLGWALGGFWEVADGGELLRRSASWGAPGSVGREFELLSDGVTFERGAGLPGQVWQRAEPVWISDIARHPELARHAAARGLHSAFGFPVVVDERVLGVIDFFGAEAGPPDEPLLDAAASVGAQLGQYLVRRRAEEAALAEEARRAAIVASALDCVIAIDHRGLVVEFNPAAERTFGYSCEQAIGREMAELIVPPDLREQHRRGLARQVAGGEGSLLGRRVELRALRADGSEFPAEVAITRIDLPAGPLFTGYLRDITERASAQAERAALVASERRARLRAERLLAVTTALSGAASVAEVFEAVLGESVAATGANGGVVALLEEGGTNLELVAAKGIDPDRIERQRTFPLDARVPIADAVRRGEPIFLEAERRHANRYLLVAPATGEAAAAAIPLSVRGHVGGALALMFPEAREFPPDERAFLGVLADQCAQALDRARLYSAEERARSDAEQARDRLALLAQASQVLAESLDYERTLSHVAHLAVRTLADWCSVDLREQDGSIRNVAVAHVDPERVALARELQRRYPPDPDAPTGAPNVVRTGRSELYPEISDELLAAGARDEEQVALVRELGLVSALIVPLVARGRTVGAITLVAAESGRRYAQEDVEFAEELATRAGQAIENARLYAEQRRTAETLQRSLLPETLPAHPELSLAARYMPGGRELQVGGDWYDAIPLDANRVGVVIGDVVGHGIAAAAVMGQLRNSLRAYALEGHPPAAALTRLSGLVASSSPSMVGTALFLVYDVAEGTARFASAGHLPPLLIAPNGDGRYLEAGRDCPLGALQTHRFEEATVAIEPDSTILLYTDGLVERRGESLDTGFDRLRRLAVGGPPDLDALCDHLIASVADRDAADDTALIALRPTVLPREGFSLTLPAEPSALPGVRHAVQRWLARVDATEQETYELSVACSDACSNAIEHAYGPLHGEFEITASLVDADVRIEVRDHGRWRPQRSSERGRGLSLIEALTDTLEIDSGSGGTRLAMRRRLERAGTLTGRQRG
jgi:PAS domain S-box-containing protein